MLAEVFYSRVGEELRSAFGDAAALEAQLQTMVAAGQSAWPGVILPPELFVAHVADRLGADPGELSTMRSADLYLACGCCVEVPAAMAAMDAHAFQSVRPALKRFEASGVSADEVLQALRAKLLIAPADELPKIADYRGIGSLQGWVRTSAVRLALKGAQKASKNVELVSQWVPTDDSDAELAVMRDRFREPFKQAFEVAMGKLSPRERNLLRMTIIDGLSMTELAKLHDVHRATAGKWIAQARDKLGELTKVELQQTLGVQWAELDSIIQLVRSRIDVSVRRLLMKSLSGGEQ